MEKPRLFTSEEKTQLTYLIIKEILNGKSIAQASESLGINKATIYSWIKRDSPEGRLIKIAVDNPDNQQSQTPVSTEPTVSETVQQKNQKCFV